MILPFYSDAQSPRWLVSSNVAYNVGDLCYDSGSGGIALPAGSQASQGSEQADQILFASKFIGLCVSGCSAAESLYNTAFPIVVYMGGGVWSCTCPSQTFNHGDLVGIYSNGSTAPNPQEVDACGNNLSRAIGKVFGYYLNATTQVQVVFFPKGYNALTSPTGTANTNLTPLTTNGAIPPHTPANYIITKAGVLADTLAAPTATVDDGLIISIVSGTNNAHTVTATGLYLSGTSAVNLATYAAQAGAGMVLQAYQAKWLVLSSVGVTFS